MTSILVLCPTRGRRDDARAMAKSVFATSSFANVLFYVDQDDSAPPTPWTYLRGPRVHGEAYQRLYEAAPGYDFYIWGADDIRFETPGWDKMLAARVDPNDAAIAGFSDGCSEHIVSHCAITRAWVQTTGRIFCEGMTHFALDTHICRVARDLDRFVPMPEIMVRHDRRSDSTTKGFRQFKDADKSFYRSLNWPAELQRYRDMGL